MSIEATPRIVTWKFFRLHYWL